jgi:DNA-binding MarR family transcriptional regulator/DNA-binding XRE family transcriptional regulator
MSEADKPDLSQIGMRLKEARARAGLTQTAAAGFLGINRVCLSQTEAGKRYLRAEEVVRCSQLYNVSASWILGEYVSPQPTWASTVVREIGKLTPDEVGRLFACVISAKDLSNPLLRIFKDAMIAMVRAPGDDLTARQLTLLLKIYMEPRSDTTLLVIADELNMSASGVAVNLHRLEMLQLIVRKKDSSGRRTVSVEATPSGMAYLQALSDYLDLASRGLIK